MRSAKILLLIILCLVAIIFGIQNTDKYTLSFLDYTLLCPLPLWSLLLAFFIGGMLPLLLSSIPEKLASMVRLRMLRRQSRRLEKQIRVNESRLPDASKT